MVPGDEVIFIAASSQQTWDGNCSQTTQCTAASPCSLPAAPVTVTSFESCLVVFQSGAYLKSQLSSTKPLLVASSGAVSGLHLATSSPEIYYLPFPINDKVAHFNMSRFEHDLSQVKTATAATVYGISVVDSFFVFTSPMASNVSINVRIDDARIRSAVEASSSDLNAIFSFIAPATYSGHLGLELTSSYVQLPSTNNSIGFVYTELSAGNTIVVQSNVIEGGAFFFNMTNTTGAGFKLASNDVSDLQFFVAEPYVRNRTWTTAQAVLLVSDGDVISGSASTLGSFGLVDTCAHLAVINSTLFHVNINCNAYGEDVGLDQRCHMRFTDSTILDSNYCAFGVAHNASSEDVLQHELDNTKIIYQDDQVTNMRAFFRNVYIVAQSANSFATLRDLRPSSANLSSPISSPFHFTGYIRTSAFVTLRISESAMFFRATLDAPSLQLSGSISVRGNSTIRASAEDSSVGQRRWAFTSPLKITGGGASTGLLDTYRLNLLAFNVDEKFARGQSPAVNMTNVELRVSNPDTFGASVLGVFWDPSRTNGLIPNPNITYALAPITVTNGQTLNRSLLWMYPEQVYQFVLTPELINPTTNTWMANVIVNETLSKNSPEYQSGLCSSLKPNVPGFTCDPQSRRWTYHGNLSINSVIFEIPEYAEFRITGDLLIGKNATLQFEGYQNTLKVGGCITWEGKRRIAIDYTSTSSSPLRGSERPTNPQFMH